MLRSAVLGNGSTWSPVPLIDSSFSPSDPVHKATSITCAPPPCRHPFEAAPSCLRAVAWHTPKCCPPANSKFDVGPWQRGGAKPTIKDIIEKLCYAVLPSPRETMCDPMRKEFAHKPIAFLMCASCHSLPPHHTCLRLDSASSRFTRNCIALAETTLIPSTALRVIFFRKLTLGERPTTQLRLQRSHAPDV